MPSNKFSVRATSYKGRWNYNYKFVEVSFDPQTMERMFNNKESTTALAKHLTKPLNGRRTSLILKHVRRIIKEDLTPRQREVLSLYFNGEKIEREIAEMLGLHQTTVSQHLIYGIKKIRVKLYATPGLERYLP
jgi:RNA polymerase sigma factor (sigma-70 family)